MPRCPTRASSTASRSSSAYLPRSPPPEIRGGGAATHELHVHVRPLDLDVPEEPAVAVDVVEPRVVRRARRARRAAPAARARASPPARSTRPRRARARRSGRAGRALHRGRRACLRRRSARQRRLPWRDLVRLSTRIRRASSTSPSAIADGRLRLRRPAARPGRRASPCPCDRRSRRRAGSPPKTTISAAPIPTRAQTASNRRMPRTPSRRKTIAAPPSFNA